MEKNFLSDFDRRDIMSNLNYLGATVQRLWFFLDEIKENYFEKYSIENPRDKHAILCEHRRYAEYANLATDCVVDLQECVNRLKEEIEHVSI